ncbi:hypothetical protein TGME49_305270 [Toxoplasma gondii ME49]|uniref:Transmembrane protein n=2 Tax=Toxoplasma gondii TaxID=5811 RepID=A0A125YSL1_TOXGV|nr:hypothetical protein TGME49_305270 [Toxoplasma gondii ME49]EPT27379.1 hypothetical protein TGME49_305270 [Toxoplasma gondii ME49]ESS29048.1 hypothetical protein TGVEG_305270 [Toxoplasma gondii VEG]|eukprot:XP_018636130.1 hypothetical protein TGME49_305270 [Toxoplasma gondii ME49]
MKPFAPILLLLALFPFSGSGVSFNPYAERPLLDSPPPPASLPPSEPLPPPPALPTPKLHPPHPTHGTGQPLPPPAIGDLHAFYPRPPPTVPAYYVGEFVAPAPPLATGATPGDVEAFQRYYQAQETPFDVPPAEPVAIPVAVPPRKIEHVQEPPSPPVPPESTEGRKVNGMGAPRYHTMYPPTGLATHEAEPDHAANTAGQQQPAAELFSRLGQPFPVYAGRDGQPWWRVKGSGYDYSADFYSTTESLNKVKEEAARMAIELLQDTLRGIPAYPEQQLKVVIIYKHFYKETWDIASEALMIPAGHNPQLGHLLVAVMLNLSVHVQRSCAYRLTELGPQVEARLRSEDQRTVRLVKNRDLNVPLRKFAEIRLILERGSKTESDCLSNMKNKLRTLLPRRIYQHLPRVSLQTLLLIPTPDDRPLDTHDPPHADGLVTYNFVQPFRTSVLTHIDLRRDADLALGQLSSMLVKATLPATKQCGVLWTRFTPAYTAIVTDPSGSLYHVPLGRKTMNLRHLLAISEVIKDRLNQDVTITLNIFFPALLKSEAIAVHRCRPNTWKQIVPSYVPLGGFRISVLVNVECVGIIKVKCRRRVVSLFFTNPFAKVSDALLAIRPFIRTGPNDAFARRQSPCFVGYARLKRKEERVLNMGQVWRELDESVLLSEIAAKDEPLLLSPKTRFFRTEASTSQTFCESYLPVLSQTPLFVRPYFLDFSPDDTLRLQPVFGGTSLRILQSPFAQE